MANLTVNPSTITVTDKTQNTVAVNFTCDKTLTDIKLSMDNGITYKDKISMTQTNATFDITGLSNNNYTCYLKGFYEEAENGDGGTEGIFNCSITNNLTNCTNTNISTTIYSGNNYSATIVAISNYTISSISVTMGGMDITSSAVSGNSIYIENVSGNIVITATATQQQTGGGDNTQPPTSGSIILNSTNHTINMGEMLTLSATINIDSSYAVFELRQNGTYLVSAYRSGSDIVCYTGGLSAGTYSNLTVVAKVMEDSVYVDIAQSQAFTLTVKDGSIDSGGSGSGSGSDGGGSSSGGSNGNTNTNLLVLNMQHSSSHNCVPNFPGETCEWKYKPRMGHGIAIPNSYQDGQPWKAFGQWVTVYRENGKPLVENVGVELTDFKMWRYNENTSQWVLVNDTFDYGSFYLEDFWDDGNAPLNSNKILSSDKKTYKCLMNSATQGRCFHPFSAQKNWSDFGFSGSPSYVVSQVKFRLIKWDESGVDNRANANLCVNAGGDYWIYKGASFDSQWRHNGDFAIGNFIKATSEWQYAYATSCPQSWDKGFPVDTI